MKNKLKISLVFVPILLLFAVLLSGQLSTKGKMIQLNLENAPFPHIHRLNGYTFKQKFFPAGKHYSDNTVLIYIPSTFKKQKKINYVVYLHGWYNNVNKAVQEFKLIQQFENSTKNAILIIPQSAKNAPDSFGGKLEDKNGFKLMMFEIHKKLFTGKSNPLEKIGKITLCGHSGAFHPMAAILKVGGLTDKINEVILFDGLYAKLQNFMDWIIKHKKKFINIYTQNCTKNLSDIFRKQLQIKGLNPVKILEDKINNNDIKNEKLLFIESTNQHNEVVYKNNNLSRFLKSTSF